MTPTGSDALFFLGEKHMIPMILYIRDHPGGRRIEIYNLIGRNPRSNAKLRMLVTNDIVSIIDYTNSSSITLTERGEKLPEKLTAMMEIMRGLGRDSDTAPSHPRNRLIKRKIGKGSFRRAVQQLPDGDQMVCDLLPHLRQFNTGRGTTIIYGHQTESRQALQLLRHAGVLGHTLVHDRLGGGSVPAEEHEDADHVLGFEFIDESIVVHGSHLHPLHSRMKRLLYATTL